MTAAQGAAAAAGVPDAYRLTPWTYTPSIALTYATKDEPVEYFEQGKLKKSTPMFFLYKIDRHIHCHFPLIFLSLLLIYINLQ